MNRLRGGLVGRRNVHAEHRPGAVEQLLAEDDHVERGLDRLGGGRSSENALGGRELAWREAKGLPDLALDRTPGASARLVST
jgi:hypothetical protein